MMTTGKVGHACRLLRVAAHFASGWLQARLLLPRLSHSRRRAVIESWCRKLLALCGISVESTGQSEPGPSLLVSNHVSWLDMIVIQILCGCRFVAKSEVRRWPLIGSIATRLDTIYIDRENARSAAKVAERLAAALRTQEVIVLFPEGTTSDGITVLPFKAGLLQGAISASAKVQPVALAYMETATGGSCRRASYSGDDGLIESIWRTLASPVIVRVAFGAPIAAAGQRRRELAVLLQSEVEALRERAAAGRPT